MSRARSGGPSMVHRLTVALTLIVGASAMLVVALFAFEVRHSEELEVRRNVVSSAGVVARLLEPSLWDLDMDRAAMIGEAFAQDPRVARLTIREAAGASRDIRRFTASDTIAYTAPIVHQGRTLGSVELVFSRALYVARARRGARQAAFVGAFVLVAVLVGLRLLLARLLRRPLDALTRTVAHYATGEYESPAHGPHAQPYAEFEPFWSVLDRMASRIRAQIRDLRAANARLALVMNAVPQAIFWKDPDSVYLGANAVFATWTGLATPDAVVGLRDEALPHGAGDAEAYRRADREVIEHRVVCVSAERVTCADGRTRWVETTKIPLLDEHGALVGMLGVAEDVTERRAAAERTERLQHAQKLEAIGQLAGGVAHDFNNIITAIQLQLELLEMEHSVGASARGALREVRASAERASRVARQLLQFGRRQTMAVERADLNAVLGDLLQMLTRVLGAQIDVRVERAAAPLCVECDVGMIEQVVTNLCLNARDAMRDGGGGSITIRTLRVDVDEARARTVPDAYPGAFACVEVADTGCGMSPETLARVFEPFFTTKSVGEGTGLGLATSHGIVLQHRGWFDVTSEPNAGTTFRMHLPLTTRGSAREPAQVGILATGDDGPALRTAARALRKLGYAVHEARDGESALRVLADPQRSISLALVDMPTPDDADTLALAERLRAVSPALGVVLLSDYPCEHPGGMRCVLKPFTLASLRDAVCATLADLDCVTAR